MLIFNDGPPRAGKTYDTVLNHIFPALQKGRQVYARVDGLDDPRCFQAIADYLKLPLSRVQELLHHMSADEVEPTLLCKREGDRYLIPDHLKNALVIVDEVHEFYPASMKPLPKEKEQFFARHGQFGMDIIVASQDFGAMHDDIRCRVERKVLFRKLSHFAALAWLGLGGKNRYSTRFYVAAGQGKFKEIRSSQQTYLPAVFPCYRSFQPGVENTDVYDGGKVEAAGYGLKVYVPLAALLAIIGVWYVVGLFDQESSPLLAQARAAQVNQGEDIPAANLPQAAPPGVGQAAVAVPVPTMEKEPEHSPGVAYVLDLLKQHRPRVAGKYVTGAGRAGGWIEFRSQQSHAADRFTVEQLEALGFVVLDTVFGFQLEAEGVTIIATAWPLDEWGTVSSVANEQVQRAGAGTRASAATTGTPADTQGEPLGIGSEQQQAAYGAFRG